VNHGLRGEESEADQAFVEKLAQTLGVRLMTARVDPAARKLERGESPEEAARKLRYGALRRMATATGTTRVAVAHTADDQAETVLLRLIRGAGLTGLSGSGHTVRSTVSTSCGPCLRPPASRCSSIWNAVASPIGWIPPTSRPTRGAIS